MFFTYYVAPLAIGLKKGIFPACAESLSGAEDLKKRRLVFFIKKMIASVEFLCRIRIMKVDPLLIFVFLLTILFVVRNYFSNMIRRLSFESNAFRGVPLRSFSITGRSCEKNDKSGKRGVRLSVRETERRIFALIEGSHTVGFFPVCDLFAVAKKESGQIKGSVYIPYEYVAGIVLAIIVPVYIMSYYLPHLWKAVGCGTYALATSLFFAIMIGRGSRKLVSCLEYTGKELLFLDPLQVF